MRETSPALPSPVERMPPEGFSPMALVDPFEAHMGPIFLRQLEDQSGNGEIEAAFYVDERHVREDGVAHEGMMMTFADSILGAAALAAFGEGIVVTLSMQTSYMGEAKLGDLVICRTHFDHKTQSLLFNSGRFFVGENLVMTASCMWKLVGTA